MNTELDKKIKKAYRIGPIIFIAFVVLEIVGVKLGFFDHRDGWSLVLIGALIGFVFQGIWLSKINPPPQ